MGQKALIVSFRTVGNIFGKDHRFPFLEQERIAQGKLLWVRNDLQGILRIGMERGTPKGKPCIASPGNKGKLVFLNMRLKDFQRICREFRTYPGVFVCRSVFRSDIDGTLEKKGSMVLLRRNRVFNDRTMLLYKRDKAARSDNYRSPILARPIDDTRQDPGMEIKVLRKSVDRSFFHGKRSRSHHQLNSLGVG